MRLTALLFAFLILPVTTGMAAAPTLEDCREAFQSSQVETSLQACEALAEQGDAEAAFLAARTYALHFDDFQNQSKAVHWLQQARDAGLAEAGYYLGLAYQYGQGTYIDAGKAADAYQFAADLGNPHAQRNLGMLYKQGNGVPKDGARAFELIKRSAEAGVVDSQLTLGVMLLRGEGVERDQHSGHNWIKRAAQAGSQDAQLSLGIMYSDLDIEASIQWYEQAAAQDNPYALYHLAILYWKGQRIPQDLDLARHYALRSTQLDHLSSKTLLQAIDERLAEISPEEREARARQLAALPVLTDKLKYELIPELRPKAPTPKPVIQAKVQTKAPETAEKPVTKPAVKAEPALSIAKADIPASAPASKPAAKALLTAKAVEQNKQATVTADSKTVTEAVSVKSQTEAKSESEQKPVSKQPVTQPAKTAEKVDRGLQNEDWFMAQPAKEYIAQLVQLRSVEGVEDYIRTHKLAGKVDYFPAQTSLGDVYIVFFRTGVTRIKQARVVCKEHLPEQLIADSWIRTFKSLQQTLVKKAA